MRRHSLLIAALCAGLGLASVAHAGPAVCSGKHKRGANPYGSVLTSGLKPAVAPASSAPAPESGRALRPLDVSQAHRAAHPPCGGRA